MRKNVLNVIIFICLAGVMFFLWQQAEKNLPKKENKKEVVKQEGDPKKEDPKKDDQAKHDPKAPVVPKDPPKVLPPAPPPEPATLIALGDNSFYNQVLLTTRGGGVQQVVLPRFDQADRLGREVMEKDLNGQPTTKPVPYYLIPGIPQPRGKFLQEEYLVPHLKPGIVSDPSALAEPSYTLFHYPTDENKIPDPMLGEKNWKIVSNDRPEGGEHRVVFETELGDPYFIKLRKIYTLAPKDYHIGLRIEIERMTGREGKKFRYQISGPRGLPIEGEWYATTYRNAVVGWLDNKGNAQRQIEDAATIGAKLGGEIVPRSDNKFQYMVVSTQFFASGVAVSDRSKDEGADDNPWAYIRATTELPFGKKQDPNQANFDDITVRAASLELEPKPGSPVVHSYVIYNGPAKVRLLGLMAGDRPVDPTLVERYRDKLGLKTINDFHSDTMLGRLANRIGWSDLVLGSTNLMHWLLAQIHSVIPRWALCIVVLTVMVRLLLFYPSRKQTAMSMRMMEMQKLLQPELEKLQEKYKDDTATYNREKMRLMMARGINPAASLGGCALLFAQAPIMMGLYYCLQESIFFRLERFLWVNNLAAPDMLIWWGEHIPFLSTPEDMGSFVYLGPYFNLLPLLAVALMLYQQAKMMPPATDPQAEQQRVMMKMMMGMMALFFYKSPAGLALYFIVSTGWAIIERQFIPKPKINLPGFDPEANGTPSSISTLSPTAAAAVAEAREQKPKGFLGRLREALKKRMEEMRKKADEQSRRQIRNDPKRPGGGTDPSGGSTPGQANGFQNRRDRDKKKRRRK